MSAAGAALLTASLGMGAAALADAPADPRPDADLAAVQAAEPADAFEGLRGDPFITGATSAKRKKPKMGLLGSLEFKIERMPYQAAWSSLYAEVQEKWDFYVSCKADETGCSPGLRGWQDLLESLKDFPPREQLERLNPAINHMADYADDDEIYGVDDYWATPAEFFEGRADCEDYALLKLFSLIELGFEPGELRVAIVKDRRRNVLHAVLTARLEGKVYVLDSLESRPAEQQAVLKYEPVYSFNTTERWAHVVTPQTKSRFLAELEQAQPQREGRAVETSPIPVQPIVESTLYGLDFMTSLRPGRETDHG